MLNVIFFSLVGGLFSLLGALFLFRDDKSAAKLSTYATPFAAGVLLGAAFGDLLPEALHSELSVRGVMAATLAGILGFFILERYLRWFHHHHDGDKNTSTNTLVIVGDTVHNALDGVAIAAAFLVSVPTGIIAAIAVALHEIPQEIGDFGILLKNGMKRRQVLLVNVFSALATTVFAVITYLIGNSLDSNIVPILLSITAGFFIYIAASDIIPEIHESLHAKKRDVRPWLLVFGALLIMVISPIAHDYIDASHTDEHIHSSEHEDIRDIEHSDDDHDDHEH